jgi:hypothetical protein
LPEADLLWLLLLLLAAVAVVAIAPPGRVVLGVTAAVLLGAVALASMAAPGLAELWREDWPALCLGLAGFALAFADPARRGVAVLILLAGVLLGAVYSVKNPELERYFANMLPLAAVLAGLGAAAVVRKGRVPAISVAAAIALACLGGFLRTSVGNYDEDVFSRLARRLPAVLPSSGQLVTAAPDAYGFWLPAQPVRAMRPGLRGLILLDPAQRAYAPHLRADGKVVARLESDLAFTRPDGEIDAGAAVLVAGRVTGPHPRASAALREPSG